MKKFLLIGLPVILLIGIIGFVIWGSTSLPATSEAQAALQSSPQVTVDTLKSWTVFRPAAGQPETGFIFYPGGRVDYRAYAPLLRTIASRGYLVVLVPMPLNLAIFGIDAAQDVIAAYPQIKHWAVGGHSLGGSMAAQFVINHPGEADGLVFWASYPGASMADSPIQAVLISGSQDGLATPQKISEVHDLEPAGTRYVVIEGGNHSQFGSYGLQPGDGTATIPHKVQWEQIVNATVDLLKTLKSEQVNDGRTEKGS